MSEYKIVIPGTFPGLNDFIQEANRSRHAGNKLKGMYTNIAAAEARRQLRGLKITNPVVIEYLWVEKKRIRDKSNICAFGRKCIEDGLIKAGVLKNDGWREIKGFSDDFVVDKSNPRIEITIREVKA